MGFFGSQIPISEADSDAAKAVFMSTEAWAVSGQSSAILPTFTSGAPNHCSYGNEGLLEWGEWAVCKPAGSGRALSEILQKISLNLAINTLFLRLNIVCEIEEQ